MKADDVLAQLACANPVPDARVPSCDQEKLKARILAVAPTEKEPARWRTRVLAAAAIAAIATAALALPRFGADEHAGASPAAAAVLNRAAAHLTAYASGHARQYAYTKARTIYGSYDNDDPPWAVLIPALRETWVAADGTGRVREQRGTPFFLGDRDRRRWRAAGSPPLGGERVHDAPLDLYRHAPAAVHRSAPEDLSLDQLDALLHDVPQLPTDPDQLERIIRAYAAKKDPPLESAMFVEIDDLLNTSFGSGPLNAALYRVLSRVRGVEFVGRRRDLEGRIGLTIAGPSGYGSGSRSYLIIDPRTGSVLASEKVLTRPSAEIDGSPGDVYESITYLRHGWTDSTTARP